MHGESIKFLTATYYRKVEHNKHTEKNCLLKKNSKFLFLAIFLLQLMFSEFVTRQDVKRYPWSTIR